MINNNSQLLKQNNKIIIIKQIKNLLKYKKTITKLKISIKVMKDNGLEVKIQISANIKCKKKADDPVFYEVFTLNSNPIDLITKATTPLVCQPL